MSKKRFQVALSFPGEHREYVLKVADSLAINLGREAILYDEWYKAEFTRINLDTYLTALYHNESELLVPFLCTAYTEKDWCGLEWRAIKDLLKQGHDDKIMPLRFDDAIIPGIYGTDGYLDLNTHQPQEVASLILERLNINLSRDQKNKPNLIKTTTRGNIFYDRLPIVSGKFFGRSIELNLLNKAGREINNPHIIQFIAPGGTGKTKLLRHWIDNIKPSNLIAWSFYSQGTSEGKQTSASPFFNHVLRKLGSKLVDDSDFCSPEAKGEYLADLLQEKNCVLVLDGLEPLQYADRANRGELKDRALRSLLKQLAGYNNVLCIITTRIAVHELSGHSQSVVCSHDLQNLTSDDGVKLLKSQGIKGRGSELIKAVQEYGCHALALNLLGNVLRLRHNGDILKRDTLKELVDSVDEKPCKHAVKVMQAYQDWFTDTTELKLLYLLGLFDHPVERKVLQVLWDAQIPELTLGISATDWQAAIAILRDEHHLLSEQEDSNEFDCHPLIREYFGRQLKQQWQQGKSELWQQAHQILYDYYKACPKRLYDKELPDTLEEMLPLFKAVAHGCAAGLHTKAWEQIYWPRIKRGNDNYICSKLGAFSDDLSVVAYFFDSPWHSPAAALNSHRQALALNLAGFRLQALGRQREALSPYSVSLNMLVKQEDWNESAAQASNLCGLKLNLGDIGGAISSAKHSVAYAQKSKHIYQRIRSNTALADAINQSGDSTQSQHLFELAEQLQQEYQPRYPLLYSVWGFRYCELLLAEGKVDNVLSRAQKTLEWAEENESSLLDACLQKLSLGCAYHQQSNYEHAYYWLNQSVAGIRNSGHQDYLLRSLLARAKFFCDRRDFIKAHEDLQEVWEIAVPSEMRLQLTDYRLEMAGLLIAENKPHDKVQEHINQAALLIQSTSYHRRDKALDELQLKAADYLTKS